MLEPQKTLAAASMAMLLGACGEGELLTLGEQRAESQPVGEFVNVQRVDEVCVEGEDDENPTLTDDMREIYFNSDRDDGAEGSDIWYARRDSPDEPFDEPRPLGGWSDDGSDSSPAISGDGLTLWLAWTPETADDSDDSDDSDDDATTDVRSVTRDDTSDDDWSSPTLVQGLNTTDDERPRPLGQGGLVMPLSRRVATLDGDTIWRTLLARREGDFEFGEPVLQEQLAGADVSIVDGFLTQDGLTLVFKYEAPDDPGQLYWSTRTSLNAPFVGATPLPGVDVNTDEHDERDPWLSPDGTILYFASDREDDTMNIYRAEFVSP